MISKNVELLPPKHLSAWRKISIGSWRPNGDSQVYGELRISAGPALKKIQELNATGDVKVTFTHYLGKVMGKVLAEVPDLNALVRFSRIYPRKTVDIFFQVSFNETELSGHVVRNINQLSISEIARDLTPSASSIKTGEDKGFQKIKRSWDFVPAFCSRWLLNSISFLNYNLNLHIKSMGIPRDCFGSMMITNVGSLGFSQAFVPLPPYTRVPLILALGKAELKPVIREDGSVGAEHQVNLCFTFDHRLIDGARGARMAKLIERYMLHPEELELNS